MRKVGLVSLAIAAALGMTGAAEAATVLTGVIPGNGHLFGGLVLTTSFDNSAFGFDYPDQVGHLDLGPGHYRFEFTADVDVGDLKVTKAINETVETDSSDPADFPQIVFHPFVRDVTAAPGDQFGDITYTAGQVITGFLRVADPRTSVDASNPDRVLTTIDSFLGIVAVGGETPGTEGGPDGHWSLTISAAPEPSTWALALVGFGGLGAAMRRRRAASA